MRIDFVKMHGLGNDFMVMNNITVPLPSALFTPPTLQKLANRQTGIGFDQLLLLTPPSPNEQDDIDFNYRIFNADGTEVGHCGNGARCAHFYLTHLQLSNKQTLFFKTTTAILQTQALSPDVIRIYSPPASYGADIECEGYQFKSLDIGNPHAVSFSGIPSNSECQRIGQRMNQQVAGGINVSFAQLHPNHIDLVVYERGAGLTKACGTGALATALLAMRDSGLNSPVQVNLPGGSLLCGIAEDQRGWLQGGITLVYEGHFNFNDEEQK